MIHLGDELSLPLLRLALRSQVWGGVFQHRLNADYTKQVKRTKAYGTVSVRTTSNDKK